MQATISTLPNSFAGASQPLGLATFERVDAVVVDAVELIKALNGAESVLLRGFAQERPLPLWTHPAVAHVVVADSPREALASLAADHRRGRRVLAFASMLLVITAFCGGALFATLRTTDLRAAGPGLAWSPVDLTEKGLVVATTAGRVVVPLGGKLPNGDVIVSVQPARRTAVLSSGTLVLPPDRKTRP